MEMTVQTIARNIYDYSSQHIAVTMWAIAKLDYHPSNEVLQTTIRRAVELLHDYNPQNIANTLWSYATLGEYPGAELLDAAAERSLELMPVCLLLNFLPFNSQGHSLQHSYIWESLWLVPLYAGF